MLEPSARDQHAGVGQRLDHRLVGVALLALVGEHALALETGRLLGEEAIGVDGERDLRLDAARGECALVRGPDVEVVAAVAGRGMNEAGAVLVGDVIAIEERHFESHIPCRATDGRSRDLRRVRVAAALVGLDRAGLHHRAASLSARISLSPGFAQFSSGAAVTS